MPLYVTNALSIFLYHINHIKFASNIQVFSTSRYALLNADDFPSWDYPLTYDEKSCRIRLCERP